MWLLAVRKNRLGVEEDRRRWRPAVLNDFLIHSDEWVRWSWNSRLSLRVDENASRAIDRVLELVALDNAFSGRGGFLGVMEDTPSMNIFQIDDFFVLNKHERRFFHQQHHAENCTAEIMQRALKKGERDHGEKSIRRVEQNRDVWVRRKGYRNNSTPRCTTGCRRRHNATCCLLDTA